MSGHVDPSAEGWALFKSLPRDTPIQMLNLIRFKPLADYPAGHPNHGQGLTGREAYTIYKAGIAPIIAAAGGGMVWQGRIEGTVTGPADEWDDAFVMGYPNSAAFMAMVKDPHYIAEVVPHRTAAVANSRLIRFGV
ncbi:MAG: DUF1330 domain-containing protein [Novosphingobium sp.]